MKRLLVVFVLLLVVCALALPAVVGLQVEQRTAEALMERWPDAQLQWDRGWLRSQAGLAAPGWRGRFDLRHPAFGPASVLQLDGRITLDRPAVPVEVDARLDPSMRLSATLEAPALDLQTQASWRIEQPRLQIDADRHGGRSIDLQSRGILVHDGLGNRLNLDEVRLQLQAVPIDGERSRIDLELQAARLGHRPSRLKMSAGPVDNEALQQLIEAARALAEAEPDSAMAGVAAIGALSAWQQLVAAGLEVEILPSTLDQDFELAGHWHPAQRRLQLAGGGQEATLLEWLAPVYGLQLSLNASDARLRAAEAVNALIRQAGVERSGAALRIAIDRN